MSQKQSFVQGTFILTVSAFVIRMLGFVNSIVLARFLGAEGIGLLMMAHPLIPIVVTLTGLGLPVAISKLVAEAEAEGDSAKVKRILRVSLAVTGTIGIVLTLLFLLGSKIIASHYLTDQRAYYAMLAMIPIVPLVAVSSVIKGYFRGKQNMKPLAFSEVAEQIVRLPLVMALVQFLLPYGVEYAAAGVMAGTVIGEATGLLYLLLMFRAYRKKAASTASMTVAASASPQLPSDRRTLLELLHIGLPTTGQGLFYSIYRALQPILVTKSLAVAGVGTALATKQYGLLLGCAFPLLAFPGFIMHSLSDALIPAISEAGIRQNKRLILQRMDQAMKLALIVGAPITIVLYVWAVPLTTMFYRAPEAGNLLKLLAPVYFLQYFEAPLHAILLGLGKIKTAMWNFIMATLLKAIAIYIFGSHWGIYGVALGMNFGICVITLLNFFSVSGYIGFSVDARYLAKVGICLAATALCGQATFAFLRNSGVQLAWDVAASAGMAFLVYVSALIATKTLRSKDIRRIPVLNKMFS
ncbi:stage V sporulation protein B [Paenibacillus hamazuiensis]|uniref:stage V sporulation protein B n=1 Tax=Paenibacillus hamazuiensis TaxID=2936508 RepID=UPI00200EFF3B|nr:stage V sporulation protein B [Paenibacillus hamazuiensis]